MKVAVVNYNAGNIQSVLFALERLGVEPCLTSSAEEILAADRVIFPGVGNAETAMEFLQSKGLDQTLKQVKVPFLGICLGLQLMCRGSEEGDTAGLGIFDVKVKRFSEELKVPHMGWNNSALQRDSKLFSKTSEQAYFYFVHSYYAELGEDTVGVCDYGIKFSSVLEKGNFFAMQFHPEKSAEVGEALLKEFLSL